MFGDRPASRWAAIRDRIHQRLFRSCPILVRNPGWCHPFDPPSNTIEITKPAPRQPHTVTQIVAGDLPVLPDPQRRSTRHCRSAQIALSKKFDGAM